MVLVAQVALGIVLSFLLFRYLALIIRLGALLLLAIVIVFLWLVAWPVIVPVRWARRLGVRETEKHSPDAASPALGEPGRHIPHSS
jgi:CBS domain containing-hemolysin-like protein